MGTQAVRIAHGNNVTIKQADVALGHEELQQVLSFSIRDSSLIFPWGMKSKRSLFCPFWNFTLGIDMKEVLK